MLDPPCLASLQNAAAQTTAISSEPRSASAMPPTASSAPTAASYTGVPGARERV